MTIRKLLVPAVAAAIAIAMSNAHGASTLSDLEDPLLIASYMDEMRLSEDEARKQLALIEDARDLQSVLQGQEWFAGMYIEHSPRFQINVLRASSAPSLNSEILRGSRSIAPHVVIQDVVHSAADLDQAAREILTALRIGEVKADVEIDIPNNLVRVTAPSASFPALASVAKAANPLVKVELAQGNLIQPLAPIYGGISLGNCTSGFSLISPAGARVVSTAGHCHIGTQFYQGLQLPWIDYRLRGSWDIGWLSPRTFTPTNQIWNGSAYWSITSIRAAANQLIGDLVCKQGRVTGAQCGTIRAKNLAPNYVVNANPDFIAVGSATMQGHTGDSGGPVWNGPVALGMISGSRAVGSEVQVVYMSAEKVFPATGHHILVTP